MSNDMQGLTMKKQLVGTAGLAIAIYGLVLVLPLSPVQAQGPAIGAPPGGVPVSRRPTTSPYLNLLRNNGAGMPLNYYRLVRPEQEFRRSDYHLNQSVQAAQREILADRERLRRDETQLPPTGHTTTFMNRSGYFGVRNR